MTLPRKVSSWDEYYSKLAKMVASRSKDPSTQVGSIMVNSRNEVIASGYNGFISKADESYMTYEKPMKYKLISHAESNCIIFALRASRDMSDCTMYVTHAPCSDCLKLILQAGVRKVRYSSAELNLRDKCSISSEAIRRLIKSTCADVKNVDTGVSYLEEIGCLEV